MSDDALRELLTSPLDDRPHGVPGWTRTIALVAAGAAAGFLVAAGAVTLLDGDDPASAADTTTTDAPTTTSIPGRAAIDDGLTVDPAWIMERGDAIFVGVHLVQAPDSDPDVPEAAAWTLRTDTGRYVGYVADHVDPLVPGVITLEFPALGTDAESIEALVVRPSVDSRELTATWELDPAGLPWAGPSPGPIVEDEDVTFRATKIRLGDTGGYVEWSLFGVSGQRALVEATAVWTVPGSDEIRMAVPEDQLPGVPLQRGATMSGATTSGTVSLYRLDDVEEPTFRSRWWGDPGPVEIDSLTIEWRVVVHRYPEQGIEVSMSDVPVIDA